MMSLELIFDTHLIQPNFNFKSTGSSLLERSCCNWVIVARKMSTCLSSKIALSISPPSQFFSPILQNPTLLSWSSSFPQLNLSVNSSNFSRKPGVIVEAAWTRRSRGEADKKPNRKSWKQRTDMYMRPFLLNVFFSKRFINAKVTHRGTSKVISVATTNARDLRNLLPSLTGNEACRVIGKLIAERCKEADVFAIAFEPDKNVRVEGRLGIVLDTIQENGVLFV